MNGGRKMTFRKLTGVLCALAVGVMILPTASFAAGTTAATFLNLGINARAEAMGGAYVAKADDASAVIINPAGMTQVKGQQVFLMHNEWLLDVNQETLAYGTNQGDKAYGMGLVYVDYGQQTETDITNNVLGYFTPVDYALSFAYGVKSSEILSYGVALKYVKVKIADYSDSSFALDAGVTYKPAVEGLTLGAVLAHLGTELQLYQNADPLPLSLKLGARYDWKEMPLISTFDIFLIRDEDPEYHFGLQYTVADIVPIRLGYNTGFDIADSKFTYGLGVEQENFALDYAFVPAGEFDDTHRFSLLFKF